MGKALKKMKGVKNQKERQEIFNKALDGLVKEGVISKEDSEMAKEAVEQQACEKCD